jgi:hypothetical protein
MGCLDCEKAEPKWFARCKEVHGIPYRGTYQAPCGEEFFHGSNVLPKKKKKKRK